MTRRLLYIGSEPLIAKVIAIGGQKFTFNSEGLSNPILNEGVLKAVEGSKIWKIVED